MQKFNYHAYPRFVKKKPFIQGLEKDEEIQREKKNLKKIFPVNYVQLVLWNH